MSYTKEQLEIITTKGEYAPTFQIKDSQGNKTNNMDLNQQSAIALIDWLTDNMVNFNK